MIELTDNEPLDKEYIALFEELLEKHLRTVPVNQWFTLDDLYRNLKIKLSPAHGGPIDCLMRQLLNDWNWHSSQSFNGQTSFVRMCYKSSTKRVLLSDGTSFITQDTWPAYDLGDRSRLIKLGNPFERAAMRKRQRNRDKRSQTITARHIRQGGEQP